MSKRHRILVEITDREGLTEARVVEFVESAIDRMHEDMPYDWPHVRVKGLRRVVGQLSTTMSCAQVMKRLLGEPT